MSKPASGRGCLPDMRCLLAVVVFGACSAARPPPPRNVAPVVVDVPVMTIDPDSDGLRDKRRYWKKVSRAYMSQVPGPVCICEQKPAFIIDTPSGPQTTYMTTCSTYY
jgi:hypothetical protein